MTSAATTLSTLPTGVNSPDTDDTTSCYIHSGGYVFREGNQVFQSYGRKNRRTRMKTAMRGACGRGVISLETASSSVPTGVNSPDRRLTDNGYFCNQYGYIAYDDYGVQYSYGYRRTRVMTIFWIIEIL